jgi:hypothetical protein
MGWGLPLISQLQSGTGSLFLYMPTSQEDSGTGRVAQVLALQALSPEFKIPSHQQNNKKTNPPNNNNKKPQTHTIMIWHWFYISSNIQRCVITSLYLKFLIYKMLIQY